MNSRTNSKILYRAICLAFAAVASILVLAGCGGSGSSSSSQSSTATETTEKPSGTAEKPKEPAESKSGGDQEAGAPSKFKGSPEITKFGTAGSAAERQAASIVLAKNLEARENADFISQCETLSTTVQEEIAGPTSQANLLQQCSRRLEGLAQPLKKSAEVRADTFGGTIEELRVKGAKAWALFRGPGGQEQAMILQREGGAWRVGAIGTSDLG